MLLQICYRTPAANFANSFASAIEKPVTNLPPVSAILVANLPRLSTTLEANNGNNIRLLRQKCIYKLTILPKGVQTK
jgi:hypothetical protein